jgi:hypothetical protein
MADITKCSTPDCPLAATCYRKIAVSNPYQQAWGNFPYTKNKCDFFIPIDKKYRKYDQTPL